MLTLCSLLVALSRTRARLPLANASRSYIAPTRSSTTGEGDSCSATQKDEVRPSASTDIRPRTKSRMSHNYADWPKDRLVSHLVKLENTLKNARRSGAIGLSTSDQTTTKPSSSHSRAPFHFHHHPTRKIALKFTYAGEHYNGLEHQRDVTPLPTVEETLWDALVKTRLVDPEGTYESHGWEKCGRTDRGVSAAGQVVSFWVRCKYAVEGGRPGGELNEGEGEDRLKMKESGESASAASAEEDAMSGEMDESLAAMSGWDEAPTNNTLPPGHSSSTPLTRSELKAASSTHDEFDYVSLLNNVLPPTLRVLSWSPVSPNFSARFNCRGRHYKYFFIGRGLDVDAMRDAAGRLVGEHDWRNLCKVDPAKFRLDAEGEERWSFRRVVKRAEISLVSSSEEQDGSGAVYVFDLVGTAFLYNQVRHIMAVLFLVGSGLEDASVVSALLNVDPSRPYPPFRPGEAAPAVVTAKPTYQMADALPLVLWECAYGPDEVRWVVGDERGATVNGLYAELRSAHERSRIQSALHGHFLAAAGQYHSRPPELLPLRGGMTVPAGSVVGVPLGGGTQRNTRYVGGKGHVALLARARLEGVETTWERWKDARRRRE